MIRYVLIVSEEDPVAQRVAERWGTPPAAGPHLSGSPIRELEKEVGVLRRPGLHIFDEGLVLPGALPGDPAPTLVFPSVHRSATETSALTVHPLGNPVGTAEVGGRPRTLVPTDPRLMTDALRRVSEVGRELGWPASFEATHHGPALVQPAFFVEIGAADFAHPPAEAVARYSALLRELRADPRDRVAVGLGGGHYAPHFSDVARDRAWAFGHILPRYVRGEIEPRLVREAFDRTPDAAGALYHRASDEAEWAGLSPPGRRRENEAPARAGDPNEGAPGPIPSRPGGARSSGT